MTSINQPKLAQIQNKSSKKSDFLRFGIPWYNFHQMYKYKTLTKGRGIFRPDLFKHFYVHLSIRSKFAQRC